MSKLQGEGNNTNSRDPTRPWQVTALCILLGLASSLHLLRFSQALVQWEVIQSLELTVSPPYLALSGIFWGFMGLALTAGLWRGSAWAQTGALLLTLLYIVWFWADMAWVKAPSVFRTRWPFNAVMTFISAGLIILILYTPSARIYFKDDANRD